LTFTNYQTSVASAKKRIESIPATMRSRNLVNTTEENTEKPVH